MSEYLYFLSYARPDRDDDKYDCIRTFSQELEQEVRTLKGPMQGDVCFFDGNDIEPGDHWPEALSEALCSSKVFVPIYSPTYFTKDYCGREWTIFSNRLEAYRKQNPGAKVERLIQPVLLVPPHNLPTLQESVSRVQYEYDEYPEEYRTAGLSALSRVGVWKDSYELFKIKLANRIIDMANQYPLPPLAPRPDIKQTTSAFHQPPTQQSDIDDVPETTGPRYVQFIYVAGKRSELQAIRKSLDYYGPEGGLDWRPFLPEVTDEVAILAQGIAHKEKLFYEPLPLKADLIQTLEEAERKHKIVVVIVDTWTLQLEKYSTLIKQYDNRNFLNCVILVPWNLQDDETLSSRSLLEKRIQATLPKKWIMRDPSSFLASIDSPDELQKQLSETLHKTRARILQQMEALKWAESTQVIAKPSIVGPGT